MADHYIEFSEILIAHTDDEWIWLKDQLQMISVIDGEEYPDDSIPEACFDKDPDWHGCRVLRDSPDYDPEYILEPQFRYEFVDDDPVEHHGRHLWLYSEDHADIDQLAHLVKKFLKRFRPNECWSLTYAAHCSKPRIGEFGGGAVIVTAETVRWLDAYALAEQERNANAAKRIGKPEEIVDAGPTVVLNIHGGLVQDVFCQAPDADVVIVDWDTEASALGSPGIVEFMLDGKPTRAAVWMTCVHPLTEILGTDTEKAIHAARAANVLVE